MIAIQQLDTLSGVAKGLTKSMDGILIFSEQEDEEHHGQLDAINRAREDLRMIKLRDSIFGSLRGVVDLWSTDAEVAAVSFRGFLLKIPEC